MRILLFGTTFVLLAFLFFSSCTSRQDGAESETTYTPEPSHVEMIQLLEQLALQINKADNTYAAKEKLRVVDSMLNVTTDFSNRAQLMYYKGLALLELGDETQAIAVFEELTPVASQNRDLTLTLLKKKAIAYMRLGERTNCLSNHSEESCIMPFQGGGIHKDPTGSKKAIELYQEILEMIPGDPDALWLMNIAYMTLGEYPDGVPSKYLIPGLDKTSSVSVTPFVDIAPQLGLNVLDMSGGVIIEDFDNDGFLDIVTSSWNISAPMTYFKNNGDGTFTDRSKQVGLTGITGGLNITQVDFNNDGFMDIYVFRGAWMGTVGEIYGNQPNSLLRNNGNGTFTDITIPAGITCAFPGQAGSWNDYNLDGYADLFICYESSIPEKPQTCELYLNNKDETFTRVTQKAGLDFAYFVKGVTSGDFDNDGLPDVYISTLFGSNLLLKNEGNQPSGIPFFKDVTEKAGLKDDKVGTFATWFWDYNNDGHLDIFAANYEFGGSLSSAAAKEILAPTNKNKGKMHLYKNNGNGTFTDVTKKTGIFKVAYAMGSNFGDFDNDGYLDFYLGTGNPSFESLLPSILFKNVDGKRFEDVTAQARVGSLQKGHGVSFADIDNNGVQDIFFQIGGAYPGDSYYNSLYYNEGQNANSWVTLLFTGVESNRAGIGTKITILIEEDGKERKIYREVNSGGSFGSSPLRAQIGLGKATIIKRMEIVWPVSRRVQVWEKVPVRHFYRLIEGDQEIKLLNLPIVNFDKIYENIPMCNPAS